MDTEAKLKQIMDVLDQIAEDTSVPRNIRRGAAEAKARLAKKNEALDLRVTTPTLLIAPPPPPPPLPPPPPTPTPHPLSHPATAHSAYLRPPHYPLPPPP